VAIQESECLRLLMISRINAKKALCVCDRKLGSEVFRTLLQFRKSVRDGNQRTLPFSSQLSSEFMSIYMKFKRYSKAASQVRPYVSETWISLEHET
jgi:hypothetical protein